MGSETITLSAKENTSHLQKDRGSNKSDKFQIASHGRAAVAISLSLLPTPNSEMGEIQMCVRSENSMCPHVPCSSGKAMNLKQGNYCLRFALSWCADCRFFRGDCGTLNLGHRRYSMKICRV